MYHKVKLKQTTGLLRLNVGCADSPTLGWINLDNSLTVRIARHRIFVRLLTHARLLSGQQQHFVDTVRCRGVGYADVRHRIPYARGSVDAVYSSHMLEHLDRDEAVAFLREVRRVLRPGGVLRLAVPDLAALVARYQATGDADALVAGTFLAETRARGLAQMLKRWIIGPRHHRWMYDGPSLCRLLVSEGFAEVSVVRPGETRIAEPGTLDLRERAGESTYVEALQPEAGNREEARRSSPAT